MPILPPHASAADVALGNQQKPLELHPDTNG